MRVAIFRLGTQADFAQEGGDPIPLLVARPHILHPEWLSNDRADPHAWVEGRVGILEHELDITPTPAVRLTKI